MEANACPAHRLNGKNGAGEIAARIRRAAGVKEIAVACRPEWLAARLLPARRISGGISIKMIVENERWPIACGARKRGDDVRPAFALGRELDRQSQLAELGRDDFCDGLFTARWHVRIKRVLGSGLARGNEGARERNPALLGDFRDHLRCLIRWRRAGETAWHNPHRHPFVGEWSGLANGVPAGGLASCSGNED